VEVVPIAVEEDSNLEEEVVPIGLVEVVPIVLVEVAPIDPEEVGLDLEEVGPALGVTLGLSLLFVQYLHHLYFAGLGLEAPGLAVEEADLEEEVVPIAPEEVVPIGLVEDNNLVVVVPIGPEEVAPIGLVEDNNLVVVVPIGPEEVAPIGLVEDNNLVVVVPIDLEVVVLGLEVVVLDLEVVVLDLVVVDHVQFVHL